MDALNNHFQSKKNVIFERQVFRQAIQGTNKPSINLLQDFINFPPCGNLASADNWVTYSPKISHMTKRGVFDLYLILEDEVHAMTLPNELAPKQITNQTMAA